MLRCSPGISMRTFPEALSLKAIEGLISVKVYGAASVVTTLPENEALAPSAEGTALRTETPPEGREPLTSSCASSPSCHTTGYLPSEGEVNAVLVAGASEMNSI